MDLYCFNEVNKEYPHHYLSDTFKGRLLSSMNQIENKYECFDKEILLNSKSVDSHCCKVDILLRKKILLMC